MKKFTMNFLSEGYRSSLRILRSVALGLVALLWAHTAAYSQCNGPSGPVSFQAGDVDSCFLDGGVYTIQISAANLWNIDSINLFLDYNEANWVFDGYAILDETFNQTTNGNVPLSVDDDGDMLLWQQHNFFQTDNYSGLTPNICYKIKRFFTHKTF